MSDNKVLRVSYATENGRPEPMINMERLLSIAGFDITDQEENPALDEAMTALGECYAETFGKIHFEVAYTTFGYEITEDGEIDIDVAKLRSETLKERLEGCDYMVPFAVTLGTEVEEAIASLADNPAKQKLMIALAYERLYTLCDAFGDDLNAVVRMEGRTLKPYIVPGDGDFGADMKPLLLNELDAENMLGVTLNEDGIFAPAFSLAAVFCVSEEGVVLPFDDCTVDMCAGCGNTSCASRKTE